MITNCPNCGGAIAHSYNHRCQYCGTFLHITDDNIKKFKNYDINNIKVSLDRYPMSCDYILRIYGYSSPKIYQYEETDKTDLADVFSIDEVKPVGYNIKIPMKYLYENNLDKILNFVFNSLPPIFKDNWEVQNKIIDCFMNRPEFGKCYCRGDGTNE